MDTFEMWVGQSYEGLEIQALVINWILLPFNNVGGLTLISG